MEDGEAKPKRTRRAKSAAAELPTVADGGEEEDVAEVEEKPKKRRGKQPDPNAPPPFGERHHQSCYMSECHPDLLSTLIPCQREQFIFQLYH